MHSNVVQPLLLSSSKTFSSSPREILYPLAVIPHSAFSQSLSLAMSAVLTDGIDWPLLEISYKWNHTRCDLSGLASFTPHDIFEVHPCCSMNQYLSFFFFNSWIIFHYVDLLHFVSLLILLHTWVLSTFRQDSAAVNIRAQVLLEHPSSILLGVMLTA